MRARSSFAAGFALLFFAVAPSNAARERSIAELTNFALSPELAQWLVGPVSKIASEDEIRRYLALDGDFAATEFIERFWQSRESDEVLWPEDQPRSVFETRSDEADRFFSEGVNLGRRSDRGEIYVLYGPPEEKRFESDPERSVGPIEVWEYRKKAPKGLDGERPKRVYRFIRRGDVTVHMSSATSHDRRFDREK